jgi:hypothetical protein
MKRLNFRGLFFYFLTSRRISVYEITPWIMQMCMDSPANDITEMIQSITQVAENKRSSHEGKSFILFQFFTLSV